MTTEKLDFLFPFFVLGYGVVIVTFLENSRLVRLAEKTLAPEYLGFFKGKKVLGYICLLIGALWSLQNLWLS